MNDYNLYFPDRESLTPPRSLGSAASGGSRAPVSEREVQRLLRHFKLPPPTDVTEPLLLSLCVLLLTSQTDE